MPTTEQVSLNPNDRALSGKHGYAKRQYQEVNQHYMHHNAVLPELSSTPDLEGRNNPASPVKDIYEKLPEKPNKMGAENAGQLQQKI